MNNFFYQQVFNDFTKGKLSAVLNFKYYKRWKDYLNPDRSSISDHSPWISFPAIDFLKRNLELGNKIFEYGGGGSTLFFLDRVNEVITVEHNPEWFQVLKQSITAANKNKWEGNLILPEPIQIKQSLNISDPEHYYSYDQNYDKMTFKNYASYIDKFKDEYFDVVLIDGRARPSCIKHSINKIKKGGLLILDNAERNYYLKNTTSFLQDFKLILSKFAPLPYSEIFTQTNVWRKV